MPIWITVLRHNKLFVTDEAAVAWLRRQTDNTAAAPGEAR
jgi:hypothetical protein